MLRAIVPVLLLASVLALAGPGNVRAEVRTWTSTDGNQVTGEIMALEGDEITLKTDRGQFKFPLSRLSEQDQAFAKGWKENPGGGDTPSPTKPAGAGDDKSLGAGLDSVKLGEWPNDVVAEFEIDQIEVVKEDSTESIYIYRSPHFEFESPVRLSKSVVREFARMFEATFEFVKVMPIGLNPQASGDGYHKTKLYETKQDYFADGGMENSGGMFSYSWNQNDGVTRSIIKVPMTSLGVENLGNRFIVDHKKRSDTLVHEISHQMTGRWLTIIPVWFSEGLAETISTQRYDNGRFNLTSMDRSIREDVVKRSGNDREFPMVRLERLMTMSKQEWASELGSGSRWNYPSANLLFYYFLRLEGQGNGERLVNYMRALAGGMKEDEARVEVLMAGHTFESLQEDVASKWRSEGLRISFQ